MSSKCYEANPDIAGVGVRVSIYTQALLSFAPAMFASVDGHVDSDEEELLQTIYVNLLLTACALLVSAFIQAATFGLGLYHALIVLNLSWIVNSSALIICVFPSLARLQPVDTWWKWIEKIWPSRRNQLLGLLLVTIHLCAMGALGIQIWATPAKYGPLGRDAAYVSGCLSKTVFTVFGVDIPVTNKALRGISLTLYSITMIPLVNGIVLIILIGVTSHYSQPFGRVFIKAWKNTLGLLWMHNNDAAQRVERTKHNPAYSSAMVLQLLVSAYFIINTELMISTTDESEWTFGQTLSMLLIIFPFYKGVVKPTAGKLPIMKFRLEWHLRRLLRKSTKEWPELYHDANQKYNAICQSLAALRDIRLPETHYHPAASDLPTSELRLQPELPIGDIIAAIVVPLEAAKDLLDKSHTLMCLLIGEDKFPTQQSTSPSQNLHEELRHVLVDVSKQISELREIIVTAYRSRIRGVKQMAYFVNLGAILGASVANLDVAQLLINAFISSLSSGLPIRIAT
jgi:hypothetical protein